MKRLLLAGLMTMALPACAPAEPDVGSCEGTLHGAPLAAAIEEADQEASYLARDDFDGGIERAFVKLSYGDGELIVDGYLDDMPDDVYEGSHALPNDFLSTGYVSSWLLSSPRGSVAVGSGTLVLDTAERSVIEGSFAASLTSAVGGGDDVGDIACSFTLQRDVGYDTDD
jgi:hypothetical protein